MAIRPILALALLVAVQGCRPFVPARQRAQSADFFSPERRTRIESEVSSREAASREVAHVVLCERLDGEGYPAPLDNWVANLRSDEPLPIFSALRAMEQNEAQSVPTEVMLDLVIPLLSDRRGFTKTLPGTPGAMDRYTLNASLGLAAAKALGPRTSHNRALIPALASFLFASKGHDCEVVATAMSRACYAVGQEDDARIVAAALYGIVENSPWVAESSPWGSTAILKGMHNCDLSDSARVLLTGLHDRFPGMLNQDTIGQGTALPVD